MDVDPYTCSSQGMQEPSATTVSIYRQRQEVPELSGEEGVKQQQDGSICTSVSQLQNGTRGAKLWSEPY